MPVSPAGSILVVAKGNSVFLYTEKKSDFTGGLTPGPEEHRAFAVGILKDGKITDLGELDRVQAVKVAAGGQAPVGALDKK